MPIAQVGTEVWLLRSWELLALIRSIDEAKKRGLACVAARS